MCRSSRRDPSQKERGEGNSAWKTTTEGRIETEKQKKNEKKCVFIEKRRRKKMKLQEL